MKEKKADNATLTTQIITDNWLGSFLGYMPNPDDIIGGTLESYETYRKMMTDPRIKSLINKKKTSALMFPASLTQGDGCTDEVYQFIKNIPLLQNLYRKEKRMLSALNYGFSVSEVVWKIDGGKYLPENIITHKPERFTYDSNWKLYWNDLGCKKELTQDYKFLQMQHDPDDENPYGTSELRSVYWPWMFKTAGYDFWLQATEKFSVNSIVALFNQQGTDEEVTKKANQIAQMLMNLRSGSAAAVANTSDLKEIGMSGSLADFNTLVDACDVQISYGLTGQSIATSKTDGGSLALGQVQADMLYEDCKGIALEVQSKIQKLIDWTVELNFGEGAVAPQYSFDIAKRATFDQVMKAVEEGVPVSKQALYDNYGLPEPVDEKDTFIKSAVPDTAGMNLSDPGESKKKALRRRTRSMITFFS